MSKPRKALDPYTLRAAAFSIMRFARRSRGQGIGLHTCVGMRIAAAHLRDEARAITRQPKRKGLEMPPRAEFDGPIGVRRIGGVFIIEATQNGMTTHVEMSEYNAWRAFGCLSLLLGIPLPPHVGRAIKLGDEKGNPPEAVFDFPKPKTLGERVAQNLTMAKLERQGFVTSKAKRKGGKRG